MTEEWREFGINNCYRISSHGRIQTRLLAGGQHKKQNLGEWREKRASKGRTDNHGGYYLITGLWDGTRSKNARIHRLVAEHFIGPIPKDMEVNHIDGNRENNHISNLEITSRQGNALNAASRGSFKGIRKLSGKIDEFKILTIITLINSGWRNKDLSKYANVDQSQISNIRHKKPQSYDDYHFLVCRS